MKKLIAVLLVVFACLSLSADDIPMDWSIQIVKALSDFSASDFENYTIEKVGDKTVIMRGKSNNAVEKMSFIEAAEKENTFYYLELNLTQDVYYFRFNLTQEEIEQDKLKIMAKVGEWFSKGGTISHSTEKDYEKLNSCNIFFSDDYAYAEEKNLDFFYSFKEPSSLIHYIHYSFWTP